MSDPALLWDFTASLMGATDSWITDRVPWDEAIGHRAALHRGWVC